MPSPRITEVACSLPEGEGRHGMHALVRHTGRRCNVRDDIEYSNSSLMARLVVVLVIAFW